MAAARKTVVPAKKETPQIHWRSLGDPVRRALRAHGICRAARARGRHAFRHARRDEGLGGHLFVLFPPALIWACVLCALSAAGKKVSPWRVAANIALLFCLYTAVELFFLKSVEHNILSWRTFVLKAYRGARGGGAFGAILGVPLYTYLGSWGGLIAVIVLATILLFATGPNRENGRAHEDGAHTREQKTLQKAHEPPVRAG